MKQRYFNFAGFILIAAVSMALLSCDMINDLLGIENNTETNYPPDPDNPGDIDTGDTEDPYVDELTQYVDLSSGIPSEWTASVSGPGAGMMPSKVTNDGKYAIEFNAGSTVGAGMRESFSHTVNFTEPTALCFSVKTDIGGAAACFKLYVDGVEKASYAGLGADWISDSFVIPAGSHEIKWVLEKDVNTSYQNRANKVWLADIAFTPDITAYLEILPKGTKDTYVGGFNIQYTAQAMRPNGTVRSGIAGFTYSGTGVNSTTGIFAPPTTTGKYRVTATLDEKNVSSNVITVHPADYMRGPYTYPGTGKTYNGYQGAAGSYDDGSLKITYPGEKTFSADGFFTLEGESKFDGFVYVSVDNYEVWEATTSYLIPPGKFSIRIWLRFGPGEYEINIGPGYTVTNTCTETGIGGDPRFSYPSSVAQGDDFRITNLLTDILDGVSNEADKIKIIHDYLVKNTVYDMDSFKNSNRRKEQDALSVLVTPRYHFDPQYEPAGHYFAVCEGYANSAAAMLRAAGIVTSIVSGQAGGGPHAWNNVYTGGSWKFLDVTWDDPVDFDTWHDNGPLYVGNDYYLLTTMGGVNNDHTGYSADNDRSVLPVLPKMRGMPDGWY